MAAAMSQPCVPALVHSTTRRPVPTAALPLPQRDASEQAAGAARGHASSALHDEAALEAALRDAAELRSERAALRLQLEESVAKFSEASLEMRLERQKLQV